MQSDCSTGGPTLALPTLTHTKQYINTHSIFLLIMPSKFQYARCSCAGFATCQFGQDDLLHYRRQEADISISSLQSAVLLKAIKQQRLKPEHVLKICTLPLEREKKRTNGFQNSPLLVQKPLQYVKKKTHMRALPQEGSM